MAENEPYMPPAWDTPIDGRLLEHERRLLAEHYDVDQISKGSVLWRRYNSKTEMLGFWVVTPEGKEVPKKTGYQDVLARNPMHTRTNGG